MIPSSFPPKPTSLADKVRAELQAIDDFDPSSVFVTESYGRIAICGVVDTWSEREIAVRAARSVPGVSVIDIDGLKVRVGRSNHPNDAELTRAARESLRWHLSVPHQSVLALANAVTVTLEGLVPCWCHRQAAEAAVRPLVGVRQVQDLLRVESDRPER